MTNYKVKDTALDATAMAIQALTGESEQIEWDDTVGFADTISEIENGYDSLKNFIEQHANITNFEDPGCSIIGGAAFYNCTNLTTVSFPTCTKIGSYAFGNCTGLTTVSFPICTLISSYAFQNCGNLTTISFPVCTSIEYYAFYSCTNLTTVSFPTCTKIGDGAFHHCSKLTIVSFSVCTSIGYQAFAYCSHLTTASFPVCMTIGSWAFWSCDSLTTISFPACTSIGYSAFQTCTSLTTVSFPACTSINSNAFRNCPSLTTCIFSNTTTAYSIYSSAFYGCYNLLSLYFLGSTLYKLQNKNVFTSTPISTYTTSTNGMYGSIFVRASLYSSYIAATNWVTYSNRFVGLTDANITILENKEYNNVIGFTIKGNDVTSGNLISEYYLAEPNMTWTDFVNSTTYNPGWFSIASNGQTVLIYGIYILSFKGSTISPNTSIINGTKYDISTSSGGNGGSGN